jgi:hypothetical protein
MEWIASILVLIAVVVISDTLNQVNEWTKRNERTTDTDEKD